jgi:hypothetical protein
MGEVGLSILRLEELVLAVGAITVVPLGHIGATTLDEDDRSRIKFSLEAQHVRLGSRDSAVLGGYHIYVEQVGQPDDTSGRAECVSIVKSSNARRRNAAMRSAILHAVGQTVFLDW